jgi:glycosyltransferase involved in cell wall biosynthesis
LSDAEARGTNAVRVVRVFSRLNIGGPALHVTHLSAGLVEHGFETRLVVGQTDPHEGDFLDLARARGVDLTVFQELGRAISPLKDLRALWRLYRFMRLERPTIVHTHTAKAGVLGRIAARMAGVPIVVHTYHGHVLSGYFHPLASLLFRGIERGLALTTDVLLTVSESVKVDLVRLGVAPASQVQVLPLGLDLEPLAGELPRGGLRIEAGWTENARVVGVVGRLVPIKDLDTFIEAASILSASRPDTRFAVVGDGEERARLEARGVSALGDRIRFFGWRKDTAAVLGDLDLVVNTSLNEGTPVALIEALAAGRPVVATAVGGTPDLLEGGHFGALVPARSPRETALAMGTALDNLQTSRRTAALGQAAVLKRYRVSRLLDDISCLYRDLLARKRGLGPGQKGPSGDTTPARKLRA